MARIILYNTRNRVDVMSIIGLIGLIVISGLAVGVPLSLMMLFLDRKNKV
jgi:hypothetical protein